MFLWEKNLFLFFLKDKFSVHMDEWVLYMLVLYSWKSMIIRLKKTIILAA